MTKIDLLDGKYTIQHDNGTNFKALRYGEEWRDLTGDGLMLALVEKIEELQEDNLSMLDELRERYEREFWGDE